MERTFELRGIDVRFFFFLKAQAHTAKRSLIIQTEILYAAQLNANCRLEKGRGLNAPREMTGREEESKMHEKLRNVAQNRRRWVEEVEGRKEGTQIEFNRSFRTVSLVTTNDSFPIPRHRSRNSVNLSWLRFYDRLPCVS